MNRLVINILICFFIFILYFNAYSQDTWLKQESPTTVCLRECVFADTLNGWAMGDSGVILHTSNGGINWILQNQNYDYYLIDIFFLNKFTGWVIAWSISFNNGTIIYHTTNSGYNWNVYHYPDTTLFIGSIYFLNSSKGFFGTSYPNGQIYRTTNGGGDWIQCGIDSSAFAHFSIRKIKFYNQYTGFCLGGYIDIAGVIWRTTNSGLNWTAQAVGAEPINDIEFIDSFYYLAVGGDYEYGPSLVETTNSGIDWDYQTLNEFGIAYSISFRTDSEAWIPLGFAQNFLKTINTGNNWSLLQTPDSSELYDLVFVDYRNGWTVGSEGRIYKYNPNSSIIIGSQNIFPNLFFLYQNYPNPFNPTTSINFSIPQDGLVKLVVYDVLGKEIATLVNSEQTSGTYQVTFDASKLNSGVYFYKITSGDFSDVKKMLLVK